MACEAAESRSFKVVSYNINGLNASPSVVAGVLARHKPDVLFLNEVKVGEKTLAALQKKLRVPEGYAAIWNHCDKAGLHGVAAFVRASLGHRLIATSVRPFDAAEFRSVPPHLRCEERKGEVTEEEVAKALLCEGRLIALSIDLPALDAPLLCVGTYVPNVGDPEKDHPRLPLRVREWDKSLAVAMRAWMEMESTPHLLWTGDLNVAEHPIDVYNPKTLAGKGCFTMQERKSFGATCAYLGLKDTFRLLHPEAQAFSFFSFRAFGGKAKALNRGWRLDYVMASESLVPHLRRSEIDAEADVLLEEKPGKRPSDHLPVWAVFEF